MQYMSEQASRPWFADHVDRYIETDGEDGHEEHDHRLAFGFEVTSSPRNRFAPPGACRGGAFRLCLRIHHSCLPADLHQSQNKFRTLCVQPRTPLRIRFVFDGDVS